MRHSAICYGTVTIIAWCLICVANISSVSAQDRDPFTLDPNGADPNGQDTETDTANEGDATPGANNATGNQDDSAGSGGAEGQTGQDGTRDSSTEQEPGSTDDDDSSTGLDEIGKIGGKYVSEYGVPAIIAILVLIVAYFAASFVARIASMPIRRKVDETLGRFVGKLVFYLIMLSSLLGVLQFFGIGVASFAAVLAAMGFAIGLAFQGTLSNFAAGIMLLVFRPFKVGDVINAAGITAKVFEIDLFATKFDTFDNRRIVVPNSSIANDTIENISHHAERRIDVTVGVDYTASTEKTREVLDAAATSLDDDMIKGDDRGHQVLLSELGDSAVVWTVRFWTMTSEYAGVKERLIETIKSHLDAANIGIPYPQMDVHLFKSDSAS